MNDTQPAAELNVKEFLRPILFGLPEEDLDELSGSARVRSLRTGDVACHEGAPGHAFFVIASGRVEMVKQLDDQTERLLHDAGPGEFFGEMAIFQEQGVRSATVRAAEDSTLIEIDRESFLYVLGRSPTLAIRVLVLITERLRDADQQAIAELRQTNQELRQALSKLEQLDRTKTDFIQVSAHELRTPVAALKGYAQIIQTHPAVQKAADLRMLVDGVVTGADRLHRVFDSILDMSRVINGDLEIHRSPVSLPVVFQGILTHFMDALKLREMSTEVVGLDSLPFCPADPDQLYKAFRHLVNNAIKYTPDGGRIRVEGRLTTTPDLGLCIEIAIEDTGIGITAQDLELIFAKFYRTGEVALHSSGTIAFRGGGPGLGLAIAQGIVLAHGGRIWAESPGYDETACPGSRFVVQLPVDENALLPSSDD